jgi:hypothetical protein
MLNQRIDLLSEYIMDFLILKSYNYSGCLIDIK